MLYLLEKLVEVTEDLLNNEVDSISIAIETNRKNKNTAFGGNPMQYFLPIPFYYNNICTFKL